MMALPLPISEREFDLLVVLEQENLDRMRAHDPGEVIKSSMGGPWAAMQMRNVILAYLPPEERTQFLELMAEDVNAAVQWLSRGYRWRPEAGDSEEHYKPWKG